MAQKKAAQKKAIAPKKEMPAAKGMTAAQKKLPPFIQKAIMAKKSKGKNK